MRDWSKVQAVNGVPIPERLPANTRIKIPVELLKVTPAPVTITAVTGNVRYQSGDGRFQPLVAGTQLRGGETVLTGPRSSASYRFADGTVLTQQAFSKLTFGRLAAYGKTGMVSTELSLDSGRLEASATQQLAPAGGFKVKTVVAVAGLRGTDFRLNLAEGGKTLHSEVMSRTIACRPRSPAGCACSPGPWRPG
ncbi:MAG TPA: FecR domain-containing protein [Thiobacillus sp.]